jgi:prevent-host-death family protein
MAHRHSMSDVSISEFKVKCSKFVDKVQRTGKPLVISRRGIPVAELISVNRRRPRFIAGDMVGTAQIVCDIVSPLITLGEADAAHSDSVTA